MRQATPRTDTKKYVSESTKHICVVTADPSVCQESSVPTFKRNPDIFERLGADGGDSQWECLVRWMSQPSKCWQILKMFVCHSPQPRRARTSLRSINPIEQGTSLRSKCEHVADSLRHRPSTSLWTDFESETRGGKKEKRKYCVEDLDHCAREDNDRLWLHAGETQKAPAMNLQGMSPPTGE